MQRLEHMHTAKDGWQLNTLELLPSGAPRATVIVGHAMMVDRRTVYRRHGPSLARVLSQAGYRVLVPDLRGHGRSGPRASEGGSWTYDDLVSDTAEYLKIARQGEGGNKIALLGHSLFGHTSLAYLLQNPSVHVDAMVGVAVAIWNRRFNQGMMRWWAKFALMGACTAMAQRLGNVPATATGFGSADEPLAYWQRLDDCVRHNRWMGEEGEDLHPRLARLAKPYLHVVSSNDRWFAKPQEALAFSAPLPRRQVLWVGKGGNTAEMANLSLNHMTLVTHSRAQPVWHRIAHWLDAQL